jgi:hypothetical protein
VRFGLAAAVTALAALRVVWGALRAPDDRWFAALPTLSALDVQVYASYLEQVRQGHFLFRDLFTGEDGPRLVFNWFWLLVGLAGRALSPDHRVTFHAARIALVPVLFWTLRRVTARFEPDAGRARWAGGLQWLAAGLGAWASPLMGAPGRVPPGGLHWPMDLCVPELHPLLSALFSPHFLASWILLLWVHALGFQAITTGSGRAAGGAAVLFLLLAQFHPYYALPVAVVLGGFAAIEAARTRRLRPLGLAGAIGLGAAPALAWLAWLWRHDPITAAAAQRNVTLSPAPWLTAVSFGLPGAAAVLGLARALVRPTRERLFLALWLIAGLALLYAPTPWQRRFVEGLAVPVSLLAVDAAVALGTPVARALGLGVLRPWRAWLIPLPWALVLAPSLLWVLRQELSPARLTAPGNWWDYPRRDVALAARRLRELPEEAVVLAAIETGGLIPGLSGRRTFVGHWAETVRSEEKIEELYRFFSAGAAGEERLAFLRRRGITHLFLGPAERRLGPFDPATLPGARVLWEHGAVRLVRAP